MKVKALPRRTAPRAVALASLLASALAAGCATPGTPQTTVDSRPAANPDYRLVQLDPAFGETVAVTNVTRRRVEGFLQVQVSLQSRASKTVPVETKFEWYDRDGFRIDDGREVWSPGELAPGTSMEAKSIAPKAEADSFRFHVRLANPIVDNR